MQEKHAAGAFLIIFHFFWSIIGVKTINSSRLQPHMEEHHPEVRQDPAQTPPVPSHPGVILTAQTSSLPLRLGGQTSQIL